MVMLNIGKLWKKMGKARKIEEKNIWQIILKYKKQSLIKH